MCIAIGRESQRGLQGRECRSHRHHVCAVLSQWQDNHLWWLFGHDQSLGFGCSLFLRARHSSQHRFHPLSTKPYIHATSAILCTHTFSGSLQLLEERSGRSGSLRLIDASGEHVERDGATLRLKAGGSFYAPSSISCVAVHWPRIAAGAESGELYHLEAM